MLPRRAFWLANAGPMGVNPDQRMHEDARKLCELSADLGTGLLQASILFATFAGVLWVLSSGFDLPHRGSRLRRPRIHVVGRHHLRGAGSLLSYWVGRRSHQPQCRTLRARGGPALFAGTRQRAPGWHFARRRARRTSGAASRCILPTCSPPHAAWSPASPILPGSPPASAGLRSSPRSLSRRRYTSRVRSPSAV